MFGPIAQHFCLLIRSRNQSMDSGMLIWRKLGLLLIIHRFFLPFVPILDFGAVSNEFFIHLRDKIPIIKLLRLRPLFFGNLSDCSTSFLLRFPAA